MLRVCFTFLQVACVLIALSVQGQTVVASKFACSPKHALHYVGLRTDSTFGKDGAESGFDLGMSPDSVRGGSCSSTKPFFFSIAVPEGTYRVHVELGGPEASVETVRAESRRLCVFKQHVAAGGVKRVDLVVHVRTAQIAGEHGADGAPLAVRLKPREIGAMDWDGKLTLEFNGEHPSVRSITVEPMDVPVLYLAGDSTVVDQDKEPWAAWGQMLPAFFGERIAVANEAESGETIRSFVGERRWAKILSTLKTGDFVAMQFAHNDQKAGAGLVTIEAYKDLLRQFISDTRAKGATPILVTSMERRNFDADGHIKLSLAGYPDAMREVAATEHAALIDLNAASIRLYEALGPEGTRHAFVHYPAGTFPDQTNELKDDTHFNAYGAYELAKIVVQSIRDQGMPLAGFLKPRLAVFNASQPDEWKQWSIPPSPLFDPQKPYGR